MRPFTPSSRDLGNTRPRLARFERMPDLQERTVGVLLGTAIGDAFGAPLEGASAGAVGTEISNRASRPRPWRYTDDTQMTLDVARSLAHGRELEAEVLLAKLAGSFEPARGYGRGMRRCIEAYLAGTHWSECAFVTWSEGSAGNGAAARVAPIACRYWNDERALIESAALSSRITHAHPDAIAGAVLQAVAVAVSLQSDADTFSPSEFLRRVEGHPIDGWPSAKLRVLRTLISEDASPTRVAIALGNGVLAAQAVPAALWAFMRGAPSFERSILAAASLGGDVDTICALTGALAGALCGRAGLPGQWLTNLAHERPSVDEIQDIGRALARGQHD